MCVIRANVSCYARFNLVFGQPLTWILHFNPDRQTQTVQVNEPLLAVQSQSETFRTK